MSNLDSIFKSRDTCRKRMYGYQGGKGGENWEIGIHTYTLLILRIKVPLVKAMVFPVVMYGCESWNVKKAER